jgi:hypothetical protein
VLHIGIDSCLVNGDGQDGALRKPSGYPYDFEVDGYDESILIIRVDTGEMYRCEAVMDVFAESFGGEVLGFRLNYMVYHLLHKYRVTVDS